MKVLYTFKKINPLYILKQISLPKRKKLNPMLFEKIFKNK